MDLTGLAPLIDVTQDLLIVDDSGLLSLNGLQALQTVGRELVVRDHAALADISALHTVTSVGGTLRVTGNGALATADADALVDAVGLSSRLRTRSTTQAHPPASGSNTALNAKVGPTLSRALQPTSPQWLPTRSDRCGQSGGCAAWAPEAASRLAAQPRETGSFTAGRSP